MVACIEGCWNGYSTAGVDELTEMLKRKAIEIYFCTLLGTPGFPQLSDVRSDMRQRAGWRLVLGRRWGMK